ncbi:unnamed protein product [Urochloa humidicola]
MASSAAAAAASRAARKGRVVAKRPSAAARARPSPPAPAPAPAVGASGWVGVRQRLWGGYAAEIRIPSSRKRVWIGRFEHAVQAAVAYDAAMFLFYGRVLPKLRRYNFPGAPRPPVSEFIRRALTVANVKAIAEDHARRFGRFLVPLPAPVGIVPAVPAPLPPAAPPAAFVPVLPAPPPAVTPAAAAPMPVVVQAGGGAASAGAGVVAAIHATAGAGGGVAAIHATAGAGGGVAAIHATAGVGGGVAVDATAAGVGVAVDATVDGGAGAATNTTVAGGGQGDEEVFIDADILTAADLQFPDPVPDEDFVRLMDNMDLDLIFGEI